MAAPIRKSAKPKPTKVGAYRGSGPNRKRWNGTKWVASPVSLVGGNMGRGGIRTASNKPGNIPASKRPADMRQGQVYGTDSKSQGRNWSNGYGAKSDKPSSGDPSTWKKKPDPKPDPAPTPTPTPTPSRSTPTQTAKPAEKKTAPKGRTWLADNYKPGKGTSFKSSNGNNAKGRTKRLMDALNSVGAKRSSLKTTPTKPTPTKPAKPTPTKPAKPAATKPAKPAATKPGKPKPLAVDYTKIPKNLNSPAGKKYLADLDAGKLTRRRK